MFCVDCGKELYDAARKCPYCGHVFSENEKKFVKIDENHTPVTYEGKINHVRETVDMLVAICNFVLSIVCLLNAMLADKTFAYAFTAVFAVLGFGIIFLMLYNPKKSEDHKEEKK